MKIKIEKSEQEIKEELRLHEERKKERRIFRSLVARVKNACAPNDPKAPGIRSVQAQLEFLKNNETILPDKRLTKERCIEAFEKGIEAYEEGIG